MQLKMYPGHLMWEMTEINFDVSVNAFGHTLEMSWMPEYTVSSGQVPVTYYFYLRYSLS
jgi:hypothetical protein